MTREGWCRPRDRRLRGAVLRGRTLSTATTAMAALRGGLKRVQVAKAKVQATTTPSKFEELKLPRHLGVTRAASMN